jgi:carboxyl-terminal processing protease
MNQSFTKFLYYIFLFFIAAFIILFGINYYIGNRNNREISKQNSKLEEVLYYINNNYVDTVNKDKLMESAIKSMLESLDPHSSYATAIENKAQQESLDGAFEGVGIQFNIMNDTVMVVHTIAGGPSEKAGIKAGDRIVMVDTQKVAGIGISNDKVFKMLRGKKGTTVKIKILRPGVTAPLTFNIVRDVIITYSIDISYFIEKETGYIKINQFGGTTVSEFYKAIVELKTAGMKRLILDLQGNSGGYLEAAIQICDHFLKKGEMIVYTEGKNTKTEKVYATSKGEFEEGTLIILIDEFSASASEIVAGAIQDNDRGIIVGRRSFGKGLVQRMINLNDGSSLRLTIARYHTPSGRGIQREYENGIDAYYDDFLKRYEDGEMSSADSAKFDPKLQYKTKKGRIVYGGGGIMPDIFVPLEKNNLSEGYKQLINSTLIIEFCFNYTNEHKDQLTKKYKNGEQYVQNMVITDQILQEYISFYKQKNGPKNLTLSGIEKAQIKTWLKALIGRNLYQEKAFYPILNKEDKVIQRALQIK